MKNLKLYSEITLNLDLQSKQEVILFSALDIERGRLFFVSSSNLIYTTHLSSFQNGRMWTRTSLPAEVYSIDLEPGDYVTSFDYLMEKEALILGTSNGLLLLHNVDDNETKVVGTVEGGIKCISPSPDGDLLGVITCFGQLLVMNHDWDVLYEITLEDLPEGVDVREPDGFSTNMCGYLMSWRGDGKYFATMSEVQISASLRKRIKIWERDSGDLHASSESKESLGEVLEWMPSGAKIATVYDRKADNGSPSVVFFERNGLERNKFNMTKPIGATIEALKWNCTSELLATVVRCEKYDSINIWSFSNNHWYLKHEIRYLRGDGVRLMWDPTKPLQLTCWTLSGQISHYNFIWATSVMENSTALVIDDFKILVTPLSLSLMPPPMYLFSLIFPSAVREMAFYSTDTKSCLAAILSDGCLCVVELPAADTWEELEGKEFAVEAVSETKLESFAHLSWLDSHVLLVVSQNGFSQTNNISLTSRSDTGLNGFYTQEIEVTCSEDHFPGLVTCSGWYAKLSYQNPLEGRLVAIAPNPAKRSSAFLQFDDGKVFEYTSKLGVTGSTRNHDDASFLSPCPWMSVVAVGSKEALKPLIFGLDDIGRLQFRGRILCNNCNSFSFYSKLADTVVTHVIVASKQDVLFIADIDDILRGEIDFKHENFVHGNRKRVEENMNFMSIWERGAKIIGVLHGDESAVIIQTTRGNLECIYPRKLVLSSIINALIQCRFGDALHMVRRHRIDFNIIIDHCGWQTFIQSAPEFVRQVKNLSYITEFVCAIKNENITETLYKNILSLPCQRDPTDIQCKDFIGSDVKNKVSSVLLAIRKALEEQILECPARELCILTTLARSDPPALEDALERIKAIREMELLAAGDSKKNSCPSAEEALKHLLWLSDSEAVFEAALGLYDLNLAAIVALNSQRDPKEFLPFLQELQNMSVLLMRYNIDLKLKRYESALRNIFAAGEAYYADYMNLMKKNPQLYPLGLKLITDPTKRGQVLEAWGDHLTDEKCFEDAAMTYLCCSGFEKSLKAYRACGNWSGVLTVAGLMKLGKDEIMQLAHELCEELQALGKPGEAAKIALEYCRDVDGGINLLITAREWEEALRFAIMHGRDDLILEVRNTSVECAYGLVGEYGEGLEKVRKYLTRYLAVRQKRLLLAAKLRSEENSFNDLDDDMVSEASSTFSGMSAYSTGTRKGSAASVSSTVASSKARSARSARRERKKGKIRAGSPDEEIALVEHLKGMSLTVGARRELKSLLVSLLLLGEEEAAQKLQRTGENFQLSQMAAVKLAEDTLSTDIINEQSQTLDRYAQNMKTELQDSDDFSWRSKVFISP